MMQTGKNLEMETLRRVVSRLEKASIPYMLTGSMALNFYGHPRATNDFDIVIEVRKNDASRLIDLFQNDFYVSPDAVKQALSQKSLFNIIDNESVFKIDLIVRKDGEYADEQFGRRLVMRLDDFEASVISPEDLILAKLDWSRESLSEMQERDIQNVIRLLKDSLDHAYLKKWARALGLLDRLERMY